MTEQLRRTDENHKPNRSRSYILRLWCADETQADEWYASLEDPFTRERRGFSSLEQMFAFLMELSEGEVGRTVRNGLSGEAHPVGR